MFESAHISVLRFAARPGVPAFRSSVIALALALALFGVAPDGIVAQEAPVLDLPKTVRDHDPEVDVELAKRREPSRESTRPDGGEPRESGQFGGDLELLRSLYVGPRGAGESNHYVDLWERGGLLAFATAQGLANNRALIIDSHGTERGSWVGMTYAFRPNRAVVENGDVTAVAAIGRKSGKRRAREDLPTYSIADIARVIGPAASMEIHNVIIAGCNERGLLRPAAVRRSFPNATNITYMAGGQLSYKPVFFEALSAHSEDVRQFFGRPVESVDGRTRTEILRSRAEGARPLGQYVAELYLPGASKPYRVQRAGRELIEPGFPRATPGTQTSF